LRRLEVFEVTDDFPVVEPRVADMKLR